MVTVEPLKPNSYLWLFTFWPLIWLGIERFPPLNHATNLCSKLLEINADERCGFQMQWNRPELVQMSVTVSPRQQITINVLVVFATVTYLPSRCLPTWCRNRQEPHWLHQNVQRANVSEFSCFGRVLTLAMGPSIAAFAAKCSSAWRNVNLIPEMFCFSWKCASIRQFPSKIFTRQTIHVNHLSITNLFAGFVFCFSVSF